MQNADDLAPMRPPACVKKDNLTVIKPITRMSSAARQGLESPPRFVINKKTTTGSLCRIFFQKKKKINLMAELRGLGAPRHDLPGVALVMHKRAHVLLHVWVCILYTRCPT